MIMILTTVKQIHNYQGFINVMRPSQTLGALGQEIMLVFGCENVAGKLRQK